MVQLKRDEIKKFDKSLSRREIANRIIEAWSYIDENIITKAFKTLNYVKRLLCPSYVIDYFVWNFKSIYVYH